MSYRESIIYLYEFIKPKKNSLTIKPKKNPHRKKDISGAQENKQQQQQQKKCGEIIN